MHLRQLLLLQPPLSIRLSSQRLLLTKASPDTMDMGITHMDTEFLSLQVTTPTFPSQMLFTLLLFMRRQESLLITHQLEIIMEKMDIIFILLRLVLLLQNTAIMVVSQEIIIITMLITTIIRWLKDQ